MSKVARDALRKEWFENLAAMLAAHGEEVLVIKNGEIAIPVVDSEGEEQFVKFVVSIPTGDRDGNIFDGYALQRDFQFKQEQDAIKAKEKAEAKARKIARDQKRREQKAVMKADK